MPSGRFPTTLAPGWRRSGVKKAARPRSSRLQHSQERYTKPWKQKYKPNWNIFKLVIFKFIESRGRVYDPAKFGGQTEWQQQ